MSRHSIRIALLAMFLASHSRELLAQISFDASSGGDQQVSRQIQERLLKPVDWAFIDTRLADLLDSAEVSHGIAIQLDERGMASNNTGADTPITVSLRGVSLRSALRFILRPFNLTWVIRDDILLITTQEEAETALITRLYPVQDLVRSQGRNDYASLMHTIKSVTGNPKPGWLDDGGVGTAESLPSSYTVAVSQTFEVHEQIEELLTAIRLSRKAQGLPARHLPAASRPSGSSSATRPLTNRTRVRGW